MFESPRAWTAASHRRNSAGARLPDGLIRRRPMFAYPTRAKYVGGDPNSAASFVGVTPAREPDDHYDWAGGYGRSSILVTKPAKDVEAGPN